MTPNLEIPMVLRRGRRRAFAGLVPVRNRVPPDRVQILIQGAGFLPEVFDLDLEAAAELGRRLVDLAQPDHTPASPGYHCACGYPIALRWHYNGAEEVADVLNGDEDSLTYGEEITHCPRCGDWLYWRTVQATGATP